MRRVSPRLTGWSGVLLSWGAGALAGGQPCAPDVPPPTAIGPASNATFGPEATAANVFTSLRFEDAMNQASREKKLFLVYIPDPVRTPERDRVDSITWANPTVQLYVKWHAVVKRLTPDSDPELYDKLVGRLGRQSPDRSAHDKVFVFIGTKLGRVLPSWRKQSAIATGGAVRRKERYFLNPIELLYELDFYMDKLRSQEPVWLEFHNLKNPMPSPPPDRYVCVEDDGLGLPIPERAEVGGRWRADRFFENLRDARAAVAADQLHDATGLYTWVWEWFRGGPEELRPAVLFFVTEEIGRLASRRGPSRDRFERMRDAMLVQEPWWTFRRRLDWYVLGQALGDPGLLLKAFDLAINDEFEGSMTLRTERLAYDLMTERSWVNPRAVTPELLERYGELRALLDRAAPSGENEGMWDRLMEFRRELWVAESCRLYTALLLKGDEPGAERIAADAVSFDGSGATARALVATAVVAGAARPGHRAMLDRAPDGGEIGTAIRDALERALADAPAGTATQEPVPSAHEYP